MSELLIKVTLTKVPSGFPPASCQVAIDINDDYHLNPGEYVNLTQTDFTWSGTYDVRGADPIGKRVMVGLMGCLHAKWKVEIWLDSADGKKLADAEGTVSKDPHGFILWLEAL
ncbi:MAG TPA: hypothetical protein VHM25_04200 [Polyangiaceae bacterium]|jgi:hypothetical protein|nr:hypothetical protein [Polyangiaceae bacterium]